MTTISLTRELFDSMQPKKRVYQSTSIPTKCGTVAQWSNTDAQFVIEADVKTKTISGFFWDWSEENDNPDDAVETPMTESQILETIKKYNLIFA